jgi:sugar/nucleoside kinase (ribokinase family)
LAVPSTREAFGWRARRPVALVGQSVLDRVTSPGVPAEERLGGSPIFAAEAVVAGGWPAVILTRGGDAALRRPLHGFGVPVVEGPEGRTIVSVMDLHVDGTRCESTASLGEPFTPSDVDGWMADGLAGCAAVVCGAQWRDDFSPATIAALRRTGRAIHLDAQGLARRPCLGPLVLEGPLDPALVRGVTVLKLAEDEAEALLCGISTSADRALGVPAVVITLGERGAIVVHGGEELRVAAEPVLGLADTVGAGDAFLAVLAAAHAAGCDFVAAAQVACDEVAAILRRRLDVQNAALVGATARPA